MVKASGNIIEEAYNLFGNLIGPRNTDASCTENLNAHFSNTDATGCALWDDVMDAAEPAHGVDLCGNQNFTACSC